MGARLVTQALSPTWAHLSETARLVLITMCQTAKDHSTEHQAAGQYFAGHDYLVLMLTGRDPALDGWRTTPEGRAAKQRVRRAMRELMDAEAIELLRPAHRGRNAVYAVTIGPQLMLLQGGL